MPYIKRALILQKSNNISTWIIADIHIRGKSMLALAEMLVVFVLDEKINLGIWEHITARQHLSQLIWFSL